MKVFLKNPWAKKSDLNGSDLVPSFWSNFCYYPGPRFSMSSLMLLDEQTLSPFLVLNSQVALLLSLLDKRSPTKVFGLGPLGTVGAGLLSGDLVIHEENSPKVEEYLKEYYGTIPEISSQGKLQQVLAFNETTIRSNLWEELEVGGIYIIGSNEPIQLDKTLSFEALGRSFPVGEHTEFGHRFDDENLGLNNFEIVKIKKKG